jgi:hypothetical protein
MALTSAAARHVRPEGVATEIGQQSPTGEVPDESPDYKRAALMVRRLVVVLADGGLDRGFLDGWISATEHGVDFTALTVKDADRLFLFLEGVVDGRRAETIRPGRGQLQLFEVGPE